MSFDLILKPTCGGCGSTSDLYGSNCKHLTLCCNCGKAMAENRAKCYECGAVVTRLIRVNRLLSLSFFFSIWNFGFRLYSFVDVKILQEYNVRASSTNDKNYFIGRFPTGLPNFSKKKSAENQWTLQKEGLQGRQITDTLKVHSSFVIFKT